MTEILIVLIVAMLALAALFALALAMHWGHKREHGLVPYVFYMSIFAGALFIAMIARDTSLAGPVANVARSPIAIWIGRLSSAFVLLACGERIINRLVSTRPATPLPTLLLVGFLLFFATNIVSPALFGRYPSVSHDYLYVGIFGTAVLLFSIRDVETTLVTLRNSLFAFIVASFMFLVVKPSKVADLDYVGLIPGLHLRFMGLAPHANILGPLSVIFLICLWRFPFKRRWLTYAAAGFGLLALLLTQSKTSWIAFLLTVGCISYYSYRDLIVHRIADHRRPLLPVAVVGGAMLLLTAIVLVLMFGDVGAKLATIANSKEGAQLSSFSGRDQIWEVALEEWRRNPVFGYGLTIWNTAFQMSIRMPFAVHAHGQFFQTVSSAGTVGLIGLVVYALILMYLVIKTTRVSGGLTLALFLTLLMRSVSEVPLLMTGFGLDTIGHLLLLIVLTGYYHAPAVAKAASRRQMVAPGMGMTERGVA
ncbi:O-antigen ligase family protein [Pseudoduganella chitinolytica]|uniref:O-antigen ligase family protein n=1 Tax=Pseudoduganella chitinolytica TaxID=34070 RepID=A0ABY8BIF3_9BURK|nr:O-antigen ligase family protein [Pseudoduganella chitinolytica]WEF35675.1 O-antigen ligase family protein [Pseudoduganella chitinolytica]